MTAEERFQALPIEDRECFRIHTSNDRELFYRVLALIGHSDAITSIAARAEAVKSLLSTGP